MQPTITSPVPSATPTRRARRSRALAALTLAGALALTSCGSSGGSSDGASATDPTATTAAAGGSGDSTSGDTTTTVAGATSIDICAKVPKEKIESILTGAKIVDAAPLTTGGPNPTCQYFIDVSGTQLAVAQIEIFPTDYYEGQKGLQGAAAKPVAGIDDAFIIEETPLLAKADFGTIQVGQGVEVTPGGKPATAEQLAAIAQAVRDAV